MKKIKTRILSFLLVIFIVMPMFSGCSSGLSVTFAYLDKSGKVESIKVPAGRHVDEPDMSEVTKTGYEFKGWVAEGTDEPAQFPYTVTDNTIFVANWNAIQYTISYESSVGEPIPDKKYGIDTKTFQLAKPQPVLGKIFAGWHAEDDFSDTALTNIKKGSMGDKTFYAKWESTEVFTVSFVSPHLSGGSKDVEFSISTAKSVVFPDLSEHAEQYYMFAGWSESQDEDGELVKSLSEERNYTLYAQIKPIKYAIEYSLDGGRWNFEPTSVFTAVSQLFLTEVPYKEGKRFTAWYDNAALTGDPVTSVGLDTAYRDGIKLYAKWSDLPSGQSSIDYRLNGGSLADDTLSYVHGTQVTLMAPSRYGYIFAGWTRTDDFEAERVTNISTTDTGLQVFYAQWEPGIFAIEYETNGGELSGNYKEIYSVESIPALGMGLPAETGNNGIIKLTGYVFSGWYTEQDFSGVRYTNIARNTTGNLKFYAKWVPRNYNYVYNFEDGRPDQILSYNIETPTFNLITPERTNYTFMGWYTNADYTGDAVTSIEIGSINERHFYAKWEGLPFEIDYNLNGGGALPSGVQATQTIRVGDAPFMPMPTRSGFSFGGWYTSQADANNTANNSRLALNKIDKDYYSPTTTTYYAKWISTAVAANSATFEAEHTNLNGGPFNSMVSGTGLSGSAAGAEMINGWTSASNNGAVGWMHAGGITLVFAIYSDRYVEGAVISVALGCEFNGSRTSFNNQSLIFEVNGTTVNYTNTLNIGLRPTSDVPPPFTTSELNASVTLRPGLNLVTATTGDVSITLYGPEIDFVRIRSAANLVWDPATSNEWAMLV